MSTRQPADKKFAFSIDEWCQAWGVGRNTAYAEIAKGELETIRIGGRRLVTVAQNEAYARRKEQKGGMQ
jgi:excisionase family DNA binding protein